MDGGGVGGGEWGEEEGGGRGAILPFMDFTNNDNNHCLLGIAYKNYVVLVQTKYIRTSPGNF